MYQYKKSLFADAREVSIERVLTYLGCELRYSGNYILAKCPLHDGADYESFKAFRNSNKWTCYSCYSSDDPLKSTVDLVREVLSLNSKESAKWIMEKEGKLHEYGFLDEPVAKPEVTNPTITKNSTAYVEKKKGPIEDRDLAYSLLLSCLDPLTQDQLDELGRRGIRKEILISGNFYNSPSWRNIYQVMDKFRPLAEANELTNDHGMSTLFSTIFYRILLLKFTGC